MRLTSVLLISLALLPAGCALTPQAAEMVHPELRKPPAPLSPKQQYLKDCSQIIQTKLPKRGDDFWDRRMSLVREQEFREGSDIAEREDSVLVRMGKRRPPASAEVHESAAAENPSRETFEILKDGTIENFEFQSLNSPPDEVIEARRTFFSQFHFPPLPPALAAESKGRLRVVYQYGILKTL